MTQPLESPRRTLEEPRRSWVRWVAGLALAVLLPTIGYSGYLIGKHYGAAEPWDLLWLRAYLNRPIDTAGPGNGFWVSGYYVDYDQASLEVVKTSAPHMDQVVVFGYGFDRDGNLTGKDQELVKGITGPQKRVVLFGNLGVGGFDQETAHAILTDPAVRDRAITGIVAKTADVGGSGVQIDFENLAPGDRDAYTTFLKQLKGQLAAHKLTLSIAAAAKTRDTHDGWGGATDYAALGQVVDYFYIMAYDEHWTGGEPGPVASLSWVEQVIRYATGVIPAQKILLGLPFYGYDWAVQPSAGTNSAKAFGSERMAERMVQFGAKVKWDPVAGENVATFKSQNGDRIAWYPTEQSLDAKLKLAYQYNLKGVALWRLGFEPESWWEKLGSFRLKPSK
jgi:spore germination protein